MRMFFSLMARWRKQEVVEERSPIYHTREIYHLRDAEKGVSYPLSPGEILRLLHTARYGDWATRNSIQIRLNQAMVPDPGVGQVDEMEYVDEERCALDSKYHNWCRSCSRPTPALALEFHTLLYRKRDSDLH